MQQHFATEQWLPFSRPLVFAFFANPANLPPLMPEWQHARIEEATVVPPPAPPVDARIFHGPVAGDGTTLLITARAAPGIALRLPWLARIENFRWDEGFCDVQVKGPFAFWRHCHSVRDEVRQGQRGTVVRDEVSYQLPLEPLSALARPAGRLALRLMFRHRQARAADLLSKLAADSFSR